jgi:hypothetical protein
VLNDLKNPQGSHLFRQIDDLLLQNRWDIPAELIIPAQESRQPRHRTQSARFLKSASRTSRPAKLATHADDISAKSLPDRYTKQSGQIFANCER